MTSQNLKKRLIPRRTFRKRLGISTMTMWRREQKEGFPDKIYIGKSVFFDADEADVYIEKVFETKGRAAPPLFNKPRNASALSLETADGDG
jgi:predicted DNA-binding transcriptional regulator AlpA